MKKRCRLLTLGLFMSVSGLVYGSGFVDQSETRLGFKAGFSVSPESADVSLSIASFNYHLEGLDCGSDWLKLKVNYGRETGRCSFSVNSLLPLLSLGMLLGASPAGYDSTLFSVLKYTLWALNLPLLLANGYAGFHLFDTPLSLDLMSEGDLLYSSDGTFHYQESLAAGLSFDFDDHTFLQVHARMLFFSDRFTFDVEHLSFGLSLGYEI